MKDSSILSNKPRSVIQTTEDYVAEHGHLPGIVGPCTLSEKHIELIRLDVAAVRELQERYEREGGIEQEEVWRRISKVRR